MPSKTYSEEFRRDAVALYESSPGASIQTIATELGVNRNTLQNWLKKYGTGARTNITTTDSPSSSSVTEAERICQLERENARLREERDILRKAAKYFPGKRRTGDPLEGSLTTLRRPIRSSGYVRCSSSIVPPITNGRILPLLGRNA